MGPRARSARAAQELVCFLQEGKQQHSVNELKGSESLVLLSQAAWVLREHRPNQFLTNL